MDVLINRSSRAICVDDMILVPGKPQSVADADSLLAGVPRLAALVKAKEVEVKPGKRREKSAEQEDKGRYMRRKKG